ncbi:MAG: HNH endonuclease, partial [Gemmatimonadaceae bacterium]
PLKRNQIFGRDECRCVYCGEPFTPEELTLDHVQPRAHGGDRSEGNLVTACMGCNTLKGHQRLSHFLHNNPEARHHFFERAVHVWPRLLRTLERELAELRAGDSAKKA